MAHAFSAQDFADIDQLFALFGYAFDSAAGQAAGAPVPVPLAVGSQLDSLAAQLVVLLICNLGISLTWPALVLIAFRYQQSPCVIQSGWGSCC
jgi:hypothetical protein